MSDYLAVGGVSAVLCSMLSTALTNGGPSSILGGSPTGISATSPDLIITGADEPPRLNLFMYYASLNPARKYEPPVRERTGRKNRQSAARAVSALPGNRVRKHAVRSRNFAGVGDAGVPRHAGGAAPNDPGSAHHAAGSGWSGGADQPIGASTLANQIEHIRITPEALTTEEIYRLWSAFQTHYQLTTSYQISVVVIQSTQSFTSNLPVQKRSVLALPLQGPVIDSLSPNLLAAGQVLTIIGSNFLGDVASDTLVSFDSAAGIAPDSVQNGSLKITLPGTLQAGTRTVRVQRQVTFPSSVTPHSGFSSSPAPFQLIPTVDASSPIIATQGASLGVGISPAVGRAQQATLFIPRHRDPDRREPITPCPQERRSIFRFLLPSHWQTPDPFFLTRRTQLDAALFCPRQPPAR